MRAEVYVEQMPGKAGTGLARLVGGEPGHDALGQIFEDYIMERLLVGEKLRNPQRRIVDEPGTAPDPDDLPGHGAVPGVTGVRT